MITGFDPFVLNPFHKDIEGKIETQNPSGISILNFHGKTIGNAYIKCAIFPVRYEDFDNGIIENIVKSNIYEFDIMMTMSRNDANFDLERFACKFRGGYLDNMNIGNGLASYDAAKFQQINNGNEFYETTLPIIKILTGDLDVANLPTKVYFDQSYKDDLGNIFPHPTQENNTPVKASIKILGKSTDNSGSGDDYLSNEVMYRSTKIRDELGLNKTKEVGHVHISNTLFAKEYINILTKIISNATK